MEITQLAMEGLCISLFLQHHIFMFQTKKHILHKQIHPDSLKEKQPYRLHAACVLGVVTLMFGTYTCQPEEV